MRVRRHLATSVLAPLLLLAACGEDDPEPQIPEPPATATPTASESSTTARESPEDFIRRWVEANTQMQNTGDVAEYVDLSRRCRSCVETATRVESFYKAGGYVRTKGWRLRSIRKRPSSSDTAVYDLHIESSPTRYRESADAPIQRLRGGPLVMRVRLSTSVPWQVVDLTQLAS